MSSFPALFVSHGSPLLALEPSTTRDFLGRLGRQLGRPDAIVVLSAHWQAECPTVGAAARPDTIHDFRGFPKALYQLDYPAPGDPVLAGRVLQLLGDAGLSGRADPGRGLDHGAWMPLSMLYPDADVPVLQIALQGSLGPAHHLALGRALRPLREDGVLILGSGSLTHNLAEFRGQPLDSAPEPYVSEFANWVADAVAEDRRDDLVAYRDLAPHGTRAHPSEEHLLPLFAALGAGDGPGRRIHLSVTHGILAMDAYAFD